MLNATLLTTVRTWKQPECPSAEKWIKRMRFIHTTEYYSAMKKNTFESVLTRQMNLQPITQSEEGQKEKDKYCIISFTCGIWKNVQMNLSAEQK